MLFNQLVNKIKGNGRLGSQLKNLSLYLLASVISSGVGVLINPFLAKNLSPEDYAIIGYYVSLNILFLPLVSFQLISFYTRKYFLVDKNAIIEIRNNIISFQILVGLISMVVIFLIFNWYASSVSLSFDVFPYLYLSATSIFFGNFYSILLTDKRLAGQSKSFFLFTVLNLVINVGSALLLVVYWKEGAFGRLTAILITSVCSALVSLYNLKFKFSLNRAILKEALIFSWPIMASAILYFIFGGYDRLALERLGDTENLGLYNVAFQITAYLGIFGTAILQTFDPDIYKATANNNIFRALSIMALITGLVLIICLIFYFFAEPIIDILTYGKYIDAVPYAKVLVFRNAAAAIAFASSGIIIGLGFPKVELINRIIGSIFAFLLYGYLIDRFSFFGAAIGQSITLLAMSLISLIFIMYKFFEIRKKNKNAA